MNLTIRAAAALAVLVLAAGQAAAQNPNQGVSKNEILLGSIQDLSGPIAYYGKQNRMGMQLRVDEINEQGGIHGRKVRLIVEDSGYDPKRALLAAQKLVNHDRIFAMVGHIGAASNLAAMPVQFEKNVINFFPNTAAREMYEPFHRLKYAFIATFYDQLRLGLPVLVKEKKIKKSCILYQDDEFGLEVMRGGEAGLKTLGLDYIEKTTYKRGATDFSSQVARLKAAGCELVVLGTVIRETIGTLSEARKIGFDPVFVGTHAIYTDLMHKLGGKTMNGLYATHIAQQPYLDEAEASVRFWAKKYQTKFNEEPTVFSVYGYQTIDAFVAGALKAGPNFTTDSFIKAMDTVVIPPDMFGTPKMYFGPSRRLGNELSRLSQIQDGRWRVVYGYPKS